MTYAKPLLMSAGAATLSQPYPARISLKAEQHSQVAAVYENAAADNSLPAHTRAVFARKADWFRLLARVGEKRERAALNAKPTALGAQPTPFAFIAASHLGYEAWRGAGIAQRRP
jgi:hypothetical protein